MKLVRRKYYGDGGLWHHPLTTGGSRDGPNANRQAQEEAVNAARTRAREEQERRVAEAIARTTRTRRAVVQAVVDADEERDEQREDERVARERAQENPGTPQDNDVPNRHDAVATDPENVVSADHDRPADAVRHVDFGNPYEGAWEAMENIRRLRETNPDDEYDDPQ